jgi:hypothetical protein
MLEFVYMVAILTKIIFKYVFVMYKICNGLWDALNGNNINVGD